MKPTLLALVLAAASSAHAADLKHPITPDQANNRHDVKEDPSKDKPWTLAHEPTHPWDKNRVDLANLEASYPISQDVLNNLDPVRDLAAPTLGKDGKPILVKGKPVPLWSEDDLEQLYARLKSGPIPSDVLGTNKGKSGLDGGVQYHGHVFVPDGTGLSMFQGMAAQMTSVNVNGFLGQNPKGAAAVLGNKIVDKVGTTDLGEFAQEMWMGKVFYKDRHELLNMMKITYISVLSPTSLMDTLLHDPRDVEVDFPNYNNKVVSTRLRFPAKLYCGQSLLDSRRESIIIDYAYSEDFKNHFDLDPKLNALAARPELVYPGAHDEIIAGGLGVRDEIRMVRPGFYLGRAYANGVYLLTFSLYNPEIDKYAKSQGLVGSGAGDLYKNECWPGYAPAPGSVITPARSLASVSSDSSVSTVSKKKKSKHKTKGKTNSAPVHGT